VAIQAAGNVQLRAQRGGKKLQDSRVDRVAGGAEVAGRLMQHEEQRFTLLQQLFIQLHGGEAVDFEVAVAYDLGVDAHPAASDQPAGGLLAVFGMFGNESVKAHGRYYKGLSGRLTGVSMLRLFVGIELPESVRQALSPVREEHPAARWHGPEQLHLTLNFIGSVAPQVAEQMASALEAAPGPAFAL